ncbi:MAG: hypothetical protein FWH11_11895 [Micrococcales bacterium]|nr:hypothetical protein [Micrococcales bacterium]
MGERKSEAMATVEIDSRGRVALGKVATPGTYRATAWADGSVLLEPAQTLTKAEIAVLRNPAVSADLQAVFDGTADSTAYDWED